MDVSQRLAGEIVDQALGRLPGWWRDGDILRGRYKLPTFAAAVAFTNRIAETAEELQHHPEWSVAYTSVALVLTTHDAGGLSQLDLDLADRIVAIAKALSASPVASDDAT